MVPILLITASLGSVETGLSLLKVCNSNRSVNFLDRFAAFVKKENRPNNLYFNQYFVISLSVLRKQNSLVIDIDYQR